MQDGIYPYRESRSRPARLLLLAALISAVLVAGCGGSSPTPTATAGGATISASSAGATSKEITDFDGAILLFPSTINLQAPAYRRALTACGAPPLGLPH